MQQSGYQAEVNPTKSPRLIVSTQSSNLFPPQQLKTFANAHIPVFFSQYGCNLGACGRRIFQETTAIYSPAMTHIFSGGIAYEFYDCSPSASPSSMGTRIGKWGYGLVREEDEAIGVGRGLTILPDFLSLRARLQKVCEPDGMPIFQRRMSEETIDDEDELSEEESSSSDNEKSREFPQLSAHWRAGYALPSVADWQGVKKNLEEKMWIEVDADDEMQVTELPLGNPRLVRA